jgi:hypothetical protein
LLQQRAQRCAPGAVVARRVTPTGEQRGRKEKPEVGQELQFFGLIIGYEVIQRARLPDFRQRGKARGKIARRLEVGQKDLRRVGLKPPLAGEAI